MGTSVSPCPRAAVDVVNLPGGRSHQEARPYDQIRFQLNRNICSYCTSVPASYTLAASITYCVQDRGLHSSTSQLNLSHF